MESLAGASWILFEFDMDSLGIVTKIMSMKIDQWPNTSGANADYAWQFALRVSGWRKSPAAWLSFSSLGIEHINYYD